MMSFKKAVVVVTLCPILAIEPSLRRNLLQQNLFNLQCHLEHRKLPILIFAVTLQFSSFQERTLYSVGSVLVIMQDLRL